MEFYSGLASQAVYDIPMVPQPLPKSDVPVWVMGKQYSTRYDYDELIEYIGSRIWMTYRRGFPPIGGTGPTCDQGWGCMLRCGQMMLAQALVALHLGRDWLWTESTRMQAEYRRILRLFEDSKSRCYSIHQITAMGVSEGKDVGQWFGPNTIAHVLRKLSAFDEWSNLEIHVAMDSTIVINDIRAQCRASGPATSGLSPEVLIERQEADWHRGCGSPGSWPPLEQAAAPLPARQLHAAGLGSSQLLPHSNAGSSRYQAVHRRASDRPVSTSAATSTADGAAAASSADRAGAKAEHQEDWRPLLLVVPLRLGLSELNEVYTDGLKMCLGLEQSVGIIGGSPNHALWFIGYFGDDVIFLDPHTTQQAVTISDPSSDESHHCMTPGFMKIKNIDPSIALGFFCRTEREFDILSESLATEMKKKSPIFEICKERPRHWHHHSQRRIPTSADDRANHSFTLVDERTHDDSDEYEIIDSPLD